MVEPRKLRFDSLDAVGGELDALLNGYTSVGSWNLGQVCGHLEQWMSFPMDGFPSAPFPISTMLWLMKTTIGKAQLKKVLSDGFKAGMPTMPKTVP